MLCCYLNAQSWAQRAEAESVLAAKDEWTRPCGVFKAGGLWGSSEALAAQW